MRVAASNLLKDVCYIDEILGKENIPRMKKDKLCYIGQFTLDSTDPSLKRADVILVINWKIRQDYRKIAVSDMNMAWLAFLNSLFIIDLRLAFKCIISSDVLRINRCQRWIYCCSYSRIDYVFVYWYVAIVTDRSIFRDSSRNQSGMHTNMLITLSLSGEFIICEIIDKYKLVATRNFIIVFNHSSFKSTTDRCLK